MQAPLDTGVSEELPPDGPEQWEAQAKQGVPEQYADQGAGEASMFELSVVNALQKADSDGSDVAALKEQVCLVCMTLQLSVDCALQEADGNGSDVAHCHLRGDAVRERSFCWPVGSALSTCRLRRSAPS